MNGVDVDVTELLGLAVDLGAAAVLAPQVGLAAAESAGGALYQRARSQAPVDTGELVDSIYERREGRYVVVGSDAPQGFFQEFGTVRHAPQPWLFPFVQKASDDIAKGLAAAADLVGSGRLGRSIVDRVRRAVGL